MSKLKLECCFCNTPTNFEDLGKAYCIDCYVKLRDSAHTHPMPSNVPLTPMPNVQPNPYNPFGGVTITC
jgi:hypothetical protein